MIKKGLLLVVASLAFASAARAASGSHTSAGCGLGSILFDKKEAKVHLILAATTNGSFGNQTFGISSDTLGCTSNGVVKNDQRVEVYAAVNFQKLQKEMAQGGGEYLTGLSSLLGVSNKEAFFKLAQTRYETIVPAGAGSHEMIENLRAEMAKASI